MMNSRESGVTLIELLVGIVLTSIVGIGIAGLTRVAVKVMDASAYTAKANSNASVLRRSFRLDTAAANVVYVPSWPPSLQTGRWKSCTDWVSGSATVQPLVTFIQTQTTADATLAWKAVGYDLVANNNGTASVWRVSCAVNDAAIASPDATYVVNSRSMMLSDTSTISNWTPPISCFDQSGGISGICPSNVALSVVPTTMKVVATSLGSNVVDSGGYVVVNLSNTAGVQQGMSVEGIKVKVSGASADSIAYVASVLDSSRISVRVATVTTTTIPNSISVSLPADGRLILGSSVITPVFTLSATTPVTQVNALYQEMPSIGMKVDSALCIGAGGAAQKSGVSAQLTDTLNGVLTLNSPVVPCSTGEWALAMSARGAIQFKVPPPLSTGQAAQRGLQTFIATRSVA